MEQPIPHKIADLICVALIQCQTKNCIRKYIDTYSWFLYHFKSSEHPELQDFGFVSIHASEKLDNQTGIKFEITSEAFISLFGLIYAADLMDNLGNVSMKQSAAGRPWLLLSLLRLPIMAINNIFDRFMIYIP